MPTKLLRQIKNTLPELRKSERLVADFVLKDPKSVITMKTAEASSAMGISEPTLIRFCKALGFSGYQEFKINLSQQLAADDYFVMYEIEEDDSIHELCEKVFDTTIINLFAKPKPDKKLSISASLGLVESKFSFFAAK